MPDKVLTAAQNRHQRLRNAIKKFSLWVLIPTFFGVLYYGVMASDFYESKAEFAILSADKSPSLSLEGLLGAGIGGQTVRDAYAVQEYILSRDALKRLENEHHFLDTYRSKNVDFIARLFTSKTFEESYRYYLKQVNVVYDPASGIITLTVKAPSPEKAQFFSEILIDYAEELVNKISSRARQGQLNFAEKELSDAEDRLVSTKQTLLAFQAKNKDFNPLQSAESLSTVKDKLEGELAKLNAELKELQSYMRDDAPKVKALMRKTAALRAQIDQEKARLVDVDHDGLNISVASFESVYSEKKFAEDAYKAALGFLEMSRIEAAKQIRYLAVIVPPLKPDYAAYPRRFVGMLTIFAIFIALYGILSLLIAAIREHARL